jgi:hypothetical protein
MKREREKGLYNLIKIIVLELCLLLIPRLIYNYSFSFQDDLELFRESSIIKEGLSIIHNQMKVIIIQNSGITMLYNYYGR